MDSTSTLSKFSSSAVRVLLSKIVAFVALLGFNAVLARSLTPTEFGIFAILFSLATLTSLLGSLGMNRALVKVLADGTVSGARRVRKTIHFALIVSTIGGLVVGAICFVVSWGFLPTSVAEDRFFIAVTFAGIVLVRNIHFVMAETARGFHETNWSNMFGGPSGGPVGHLLFLITIAIAWYSLGGLTLAVTLVAYLLAFTVTLPTLVWKVYSLAPFATHASSALQLENQAQAEVDPSLTQTCPTETVPQRAIWALAIPLMLTQALGLTLSQADIWLAGAMALPASVAIYCAAQRLLAFLTIPLQISGTAIVSFIPELIAKRDTTKLQQMIGLATFVSGLPGIAIATVLILFPETALSLVFGDYYTQAAAILQILVIGQLVSVMTGPCEILLMMAGHQNKTLAVNVVAAVAIAILGYIGIHLYGIHGLAIAISSVTACQNIFNWWMANKLVGVWTNFDVSYLPQTLSQLRGHFVTRKGNVNAAS